MKFLSLVILFGVLGCGQKAYSPYVGGVAANNSSPNAPNGDEKSTKSTTVGKAEQQSSDSTNPLGERRIIFTGRLELIVESLPKVQENLVKSLAVLQGYIEKSEIIGDTGSTRIGRWTIRVPVARFQEAMDTLVTLGYPSRNGTDSRDVTLEFADTESRLKTLRAVEEKINTLIKNAPNQVDQILTLEREAARVRGEIEQTERHLRTLARLSSLSTIELSVREVAKFTPPDPEPQPNKPTFGERVRSTYEKSYENLESFGTTLALVCAGLAPWLPVIVIGGWLAGRLVRMMSWNTALRRMNEVLPPSAQRAPRRHAGETDPLKLQLDDPAVADTSAASAENRPSAETKPTEPS